MEKTTRCSIIIYDDFNNVLIEEIGKGKRDSPEVWCIFEKTMKGKETQEKCITKAIDKALKCNVFDLNSFKEYVSVGEKEEVLSVYTGKIRETVVCHKDINKINWISQSEMNKYDFSVQDKEALLDFFKK